MTETNPEKPTETAEELTPREKVIKQADTLLQGLAVLLGRLVDAVFPPPITEWTGSSEIPGETPVLTRTKFTKPLWFPAAKEILFRECVLGDSVRLFTLTDLAPVKVTFEKCQVPDSLKTNTAAYTITIKD